MVKLDEIKEQLAQARTDGGHDGGPDVYDALHLIGEILEYLAEKEAE